MAARVEDSKDRSKVASLRIEVFELVRPTKVSAQGIPVRQIVLEMIRTYLRITEAVFDIMIGRREERGER
jgi:hypothetical protein